MDIDVTTTAVIRPSILEDTLKTFFENVFSPHHNYTLILNIDPIGDNTFSAMDVVTVAKKYFTDVHYHIGESPDFPKAVKWVWKNSSSEFVFHLEDMWYSSVKVNFDDFIYVLENYPKIANIFMYKSILADKSEAPKFYPSYLCSHDKRLFLQAEKPLLSPGLYRGEFLRSMASMMNDQDNPELQIWGDKSKPRDEGACQENKRYLASWDYAIYTAHWRLPFWNFRIHAVDLINGRKWKRANGFFKKDPFSPWEILEK